MGLVSWGLRGRLILFRRSLQEELDTSVRTGTWRTQAHNEPILDQAFRTSPEVILIFGANRQGCFHGYAIMRSAIRPAPRERRSVSWSSKLDQSGSSKSSGTKSGSTPGSKNQPLSAEPIKEENSGSGSSPEEEKKEPKPAVRPEMLHARSSDVRLASSSPGELTPGDEVKYPRPSPLVSHWGGERKTAPAKLDPGSAASEVLPEERAATLDPEVLRAVKYSAFAEAAAAVQSGGIDLDGGALEQKKVEGVGEEDRGDGVVRKDMAAKSLPDPIEYHKQELEIKGHPSSFSVPVPTPVSGTNPASLAASHIDQDLTPPALAPEVSGDDNGGGGGDDDDKKEKDGDGWGQPFRVDWIRTEPLAFSRLKHLRNPWNQDKEIKVSRDGTEVEPSE